MRKHNHALAGLAALACLTVVLTTVASWTQAGSSAAAPTTGTLRLPAAVTTPRDNPGGSGDGPDGPGGQGSGDSPGAGDNPGGAGGHDRRRPNIVMIMADDMRSDDLRFAPNVRRLIGAKGIEFRNSFSPYPLCCPARASFLSGMYAHNHGVFSHERPYGFGSFDDSFTVATALQRGGYNTGFIGKYLNNYGNDRSLVTGGRSWDYVPAGWTAWEGSVEKAPGSPATGGTYNYFNTSFNVNGHIENGHQGEYQTNVLGRKTRRLITRFHRDRKPFFIWMSSVAPHQGSPREPGDPLRLRAEDGTRDTIKTPARPGWVKGRFDARITRPPGLPRNGGSPEADMSDKPRYLRRLPDLSPQVRAGIVNAARQRAEAIFVLDQEVGRIVRRLKRTHELAHTVLMFTSDNGFFLGEHRVPVGKVKPQEPSLRVPFLVRGPGIPAGQDRFDPIGTPDITATITDLAGVSGIMAAHRTPDGRSRLRTMRDGDRGWTVPVVVEAMLRHPFKAVKNRRLGFDDARDAIGLRTSRWKYVRYATGETEMYDEWRDPNELDSIARDPSYKRVRRELARLWLAYKDCAGASCQVRLPADLVAGPDRERREERHEFAGRKARTGYGY